MCQKSMEHFQIKEGFVNNPLYQSSIQSCFFFPRRAHVGLVVRSCFLRVLDLTRPLNLGDIMENFTGFLFDIGCFVFVPQFLGIRYTYYI